MGSVVDGFRAMGPEQLFLVLVVLGCYALALSEFMPTRARLFAGSTGIVSAAGFTALSASWEAGFFLVAFVPVAIALFALSAWTLWALAERQERRVATPAPTATPRPHRAAASPLSRLWARLRFIERHGIA